MATDGEILDAVQMIAQTEGIFTEPAGGTTLACAIKLIENGSIPRDDRSWSAVRATAQDRRSDDVAHEGAGAARSCAERVRRLHEQGQTPVAQ